MASTYLNRNASATATTFTYSVWLKRSNLASDYQYFFSYQSSGGGSNAYGLAFNGTTNKMYYYGTGGTATTDAVFRDPAAWYHVVLSVSSGTGTLYVNNETVKSSIAVDQVTSGEGMTIGAYKYGSTIDYQFDGYMAQAHFTDGYAYTPSTFGSTATNGQWVPTATPSVTYGTNGFFLKFTNASDLGEDFSGNNNDFTKTGSGDKVPDSPQNVFSTFSDNNKSASMLMKQGGLKAEANGADQAAATTIGITAGKWYFEFYYPAGDNPELGLIPFTKSPAGQSSSASTSLAGTAFITNNGGMRTGAWATTDTTGLSSQSSESIIGVAVDANAGKMWFTNGSGTYFNSGNPATGSNPQATFDADWLSQTGGVLPYALVATGAGNYATANFGQDSSFGGAKTAQNNADGNGEGEFYYAVPSGYLALCTKNLSSSLTIPIGKGDSYFKPLTWSGDNTTRNFTLGFQPSLVWIKCRNASAGHVLYDSSRGAGKELSTSGTGAETTSNDFGAVTAFNTDGFTTTPGSYSGYESGDVNMSGRTYVGWSWRANGGTTSTNTDGSITSTVQVNTTAGFSIVTYTGTQSNATVGHGLGVPPKMIICKCRTTDNNWPVYHASITAEKYLRINTTAAQDDSAIFWNDTEPTNSVFSVGVSDESNKSGGSQLAYCFAEKKGFSKMGKFSGNSNTDGPFIYTGFSTKWVMYKNITSATDWMIFDEERIENIGASRYYYLEPNTGDNEGYSRIEFLSNGFKLRENAESGAKFNQTGQTYIYMAFAENPFVDSSGVPATAR